MANINTAITRNFTALGSVHSGAVTNTIYYNGIIAQLIFGSASRTWTESDVIGVVPSDMRPRTKIYLSASTYNSNDAMLVSVDTDGTVKYEAKTSISGRIYINTMWFI